MLTICALGVILGEGLSAQGQGGTTTKAKPRAQSNASAAANSEPSLQQSMRATLDYVASEMAADGVVRPTGLKIISSLKYRLDENGEYRDAVLFFTIGLTLAGEATTEIDTVSLSNLNPSSVSTGDSGRAISLRTADERDIILSSNHFSNTYRWEPSRAGITFFIKDGADSDGVVNALKRAISLAHRDPDNVPLEETIAWMKNFLTDHGHFAGAIEANSGNTFTESYTSELTDANGCALRIKNTVSKLRDGTNVLSNTWNMSQIDPGSLKSTPTNIHFGIDERDITVEGAAVSARYTSGGEVGEIFIRPPEEANHMMKALSHAIELCGGKRSAF